MNTTPRHAADRIRLTDRQLKQLSSTGTLRVLVPLPLHADTPEALARWTEAQWLDYYADHSHANYNFEAVNQLPVACEHTTLPGVDSAYLIYTFGKPSDAAPSFATFARWTPGDWDNPAATEPEDFYKNQHIALAKRTRMHTTAARTTQKSVNLTREAFDAFDTYYNFLFEKSGDVSKQEELSRLLMLAIEHFGNLSEPVKRAATMLPDAQQIFVERIVEQVKALRPPRSVRRRRRVLLAP